MSSLGGLTVESIFPSWSSMLPWFLKGLLFPPLARLCQILFERTHQIKYLHLSTRYSFATLALTTMNHPSRPYYQSRLGEILYSRFLATRCTIDLQVAGILQEKAIQGVLPETWFFQFQRQVLCETYHKRYQLWGKLEDLDAEIALERSTIALLPTNHKNIGSWFRSLAYAYHERYKALGHAEDADAELSAALSALMTTPEHDKRLPSTHATLASAYSNQFVLRRKQEDIDAALKWALASVSKPSHSSVMCIYWLNLSNIYVTRYNNSEELLDTDRATEAALKCIEYPEGRMGIHYHAISCCYTLKYERLKRDEDLQESIKWARQAVGSNTQIHRGVFSHQLATRLIAQYDKSGEVEHLESAFTCSDEAVRTVRRGLDRTPQIHFTHANILTRRYRRYQNRRDLEMAMQYVKSSIEATRETDKYIHSRRELLVEILRIQSKLDSNAQLLHEALELQTSIVSATLPSSHQASTRYRILANIHERVYWLTGPRHHRDDAMRWNLAALHASSPDDPNRADCLAGLVQRYYDRYLRLREPDDLEKAIKYGQELRSIAAPDDPSQAFYLQQLGDVYAHRWGFWHEERDREQALSLFAQVCVMENVNPDMLWSAVRRWVMFTRDMKEHQPIDAYRAGYRILPELFSLSSDMKSRHETLVRYDLETFFSNAIRSCVQRGVLELAVEFLEQSLSLTFQQLLDLRTDLAELKEKHPTHALLLEKVSKDLLLVAGSSSVDNMQAVDQSDWAKQRKLAQERSGLLKTIHELPGFENFLKPVGFDVLAAAADHGPVIIVNSTRYICEAIIIFPGGKLVRVHLTGANAKDVVRQSNKLKRALGKMGIQARGKVGSDEVMTQENNNELGQETPGNERGMRQPRSDPPAAIKEILSWTWSILVQPVFLVLAANGCTGGRIWWCLSGLLSNIPFHAAGPPNTYIQSYTSTLSALIRARKSMVDKSNSRVLAIGLTEIQNNHVNKLLNVRTEIEAVQEAIGNAPISILMNEAATLACVSEHLPRANWLHLACHGQQGDAQEPLKSGLLLYDNKLELEKIIHTDIPDANFVFLSACETAMGDVSMSGESLHFAGGMIFAGFKAVIGTLWSINDDDGPIVARMVYSHVFGEGQEPDVLKTAEALHLAVQKLRREGVPPHRWVPFIHIGI